VVLVKGRILRFDEVRGYGFIAPREGGEDVFMHANDLVDEKRLYQEGSEVEFFIEMGEKGPKASEIRLIHQSAAHKIPRTTPEFRAQQPSNYQSNETERNIASIAQFSAELTDALLDSVDTLSAGEIKQVRACVIELVQARGWVTSA
jgi:CspA family cold shock protein